LVSNGPVNLIADIAGYTTRPRLSTEDLAELDWSADRADNLTLGSTTVGDAPTSLAFDGSNIWWLNSGTNDELRKISATVEGTDLILLTPIALPNCTNPSDIAYGFNSIWAVCTGTNRVIRVNATTNAIEAANIAVGTSPNAVAVNANSVFVTNTGSNNVSRISPTTNTVAETIALPVGAGPGEITRGADQSSLFGSSRDMWVVNGTGDSVSKITTGSLPTSVTTFNVGIGDAPNSIAFDGTDVWVGVTNDPDPGNQAVVHRVADNGTILATVPLGSTFFVPTDLVFDGTSLWAIQPLTTVTTRIDPIGNAISGTIDVDFGLGSGIFDGTSLWAARPGSDQVQRLRTS
jgi:YVTN family beta-propeller protein